MILISVLLQASLCAGRIEDRLPHPMQPLPKPDPGVTYVDPSFGTKVTRITSQFGVTGENAIIKPMYSTMPAWNADESAFILWSRQFGHILYWGEAPYPPLRLLEPFHPSDIEQILWDPVDPNVLYYPSNYEAKPIFQKQTMKPWQTVPLHDFGTPPTNCPLDWSQLLRLGDDPQWMGYGPGKIVGLSCGAKKFLYSIAADKVLAVASIPWSTNAPIVGPSDTVDFLDGFVTDVLFHFLRYLKFPIEHASMGRDTIGHDRWNTVSFDGTPQGSLVSWDLQTGVPKVIVGPPDYPYPPSTTHLSAIAPKAPGWVAVGMVGAHTGQTLLDNEIILANVDTKQTCRLAHARTLAGSDCGPNHDQCPWGYWAETHLNISPSGTRIIFGSDWMGSSSVDTYLIDLRSH